MENNKKKTPREELMESLSKNHENYKKLPLWLRSSVPAELIFEIPKKVKK
jgi:hypothetical protein